MKALQAAAFGAVVAFLLWSAPSNAQDMIVPGDPAANVVAIAPVYPHDTNTFGGIVIAEEKSGDGWTLYVASVDHDVDKFESDDARAIFARISASGFPIHVVKRYPKADVALLRIPNVSDAARQEIGLQIVPLAVPSMPGDGLNTVTHPVLENRQNYWMRDWSPTLHRVETDGLATVYSVSRCVFNAENADICNVSGRSGGAVFDRYGGLVGLVSRNRGDTALVGSIKPLLDELNASKAVETLVSNIRLQFMSAAVQQRVTEVDRLCHHVDNSDFDVTLFRGLSAVVRTGAQPLIDALIDCVKSRDHEIEFGQQLGNKSTLLVEAAYSGQFQLVRFLLEEARVNPNQVTGTGETALSATLGHQNILPEKRLKMAELLLSHGAVPDHPQKEGKPSVLTVTRSNDMGPRQGDLIELLVKYGADPLTTYEERLSDDEARRLYPLVDPAEDRSSALSAWKLFIDTYKADLNVVNHKGLTPLMILAGDGGDVPEGVFAEGDRGGCWSGPDDLSLKAMLLLKSGRVDLKMTDPEGLTAQDHLKKRRILTPGDERCSKCMAKALEFESC
ncbi:MAG: hypothetical protein OXJ64_05145 [Boseongicola sp.]|nr:hypothetical protein [Boseongicola sp.]